MNAYVRTEFCVMSVIVASFVGRFYLKLKTNFRRRSHYQKFFLSGYSNTCTVLQQTKQGLKSTLC